MDTQALRWFTMVAEGATVTEVAELEMMSQPGVSRAIARLEKDVGAPLFHRQGRQLIPTHAGAAFHRHAESMLRHLDDGMAAVQQQMDPESGIITLALQPSLGTWLVPDLIGSYRDRHPRARFDLYSKSDERTPLVGTRSAIDLELSTLKPGGQEGLAWRPLVTEPIRLLIPRDHRLAERRSARLADVKDDLFISLRDTSLLRSQLDRLCEQAAFVPDIGFVADDLAALRGYVAAGLGVAIIPARWGAGAIEPPSPLVRYLELEDDGATREVGLSWSPERHLLPAAELFRAFVLHRAERGELPTPLAVS